jgi:Glycosyltransferase family 87
VTAAEGPAGSVMRAGRAGATNRTMANWLLAAGVVAFAVSIAGLITLFVARPAELWSMVDVQVYMWGGHMARLVGTPYQGAYQFYNLHLPFTYPPMAAAVFGLVSYLPLAAVKWLITSASVAALAGVTWLSWGKLGYGRSRSRLGATLLVAAIAVWLEPVQQTLAFGQVNAVLMLVVVADLCLSDGNRLKGVGVGLASGFKLTPLIFVPYLLLTRQYRAAVVALGTFGFTIAASDLLIPRAARQFWAGRMFLSVSRVGNIAYVGNQSLYGASIRLLGSARAAHPYYLAAATVIGLAGLLVAAGLSRLGQELAGLVACALTGLLVSPVSWSHHWVWIAPTLVLVTDLAVRAGKAARLRPGRVAGRLALTAAGLAVIAVLALYIAYPFHAVPGAPRLPAGLIWTMPQQALQGKWLTGYQELVGNLYVLAGLVGLTAVAAWLLAQAPGRAKWARSARLRRTFQRSRRRIPARQDTS